MSSAASHVELSDTRDVIGRGETLGSVRFPNFHVFDANWRLKLASEWDETAAAHKISIKLSHQRRKTGDPWEMTGAIGLRIETSGMCTEEKIVDDCRFSHVQNRLEIKDLAVLTGNGQFEGKCEGVEVKVHIFMQIHYSMGIQPRYFMDFSQKLPIFSDAVVHVSGTPFHVNRTIVSMASGVFFRAFLRMENDGKREFDVGEEEIGGFLKDPHDFRRILNLIYPPHLVPKQWIKEPDWRKQLAHIYRILEIAKSLECGIALETADEWITKYGRFDFGHSVVLAQSFGLRRLMGSKIAGIAKIAQLRECSEFELFSQKTKALIFDHVLTLI